MLCAVRIRMRWHRRTQKKNEEIHSLCAVENDFLLSYCSFGYFLLFSEAVSFDPFSMRKCLQLGFFLAAMVRQLDIRRRGHTDKSRPHRRERSVCGIAFFWTPHAPTVYLSTHSFYGNVFIFSFSPPLSPVLWIVRARFIFPCIIVGASSQSFLFRIYHEYIDDDNTC